jgi:hypothetical protein
MDSGFLPAVASLLQKPEFARLNGRLTTVSVSDLLTRDDYYVIDSHLRPSGHAKVATRIAEYIK